MVKDIAKLYLYLPASAPNSKSEIVSSQSSHMYFTIIYSNTYILIMICLKYKP